MFVDYNEVNSPCSILVPLFSFLKLNNTFLTGNFFSLLSLKLREFTLLIWS